MSDTQVMEMPIKRFWLFSECIDRMNSSDDLRFLANQSSLNSKEGMDGRLSELNENVGTLVIRDFKRDVEGVSRLKMMLS